MKANESPEKIYMTPCFGAPNNVLLATFSKSHLNFHRDIEYTRTDAFIDKAVEWISNNCYIPHSTLEDFKKYMEGE